jgi:hypothetical protein
VDSLIQFPCPAHHPPRPAAPSYRDWKAEASKQLRDRHDIPAAAIPAREWTRLYIRRFSPEEAADRAATEYNNRPKWAKKR